MNKIVKEILEIISERIEDAYQEIKEQSEQKSVAFGYDMGALDTLRYLRNEIEEKYK